MASEAVIIELGSRFGEPRSYTCASGTAIAKGTLLKLSTPNTVAATSSTDLFAGIAAMDKSATDYTTKISAYTAGDFDLVLAPAATCAVGQLLVMSGANILKACTTAAEISGGFIVGRAMEAGSAADTIRVRIAPGLVN